VSQQTASKLLKAFYAAAVAFLGGLVAILVGNQPFSRITDGQWVSLALVALTAFGGVYGLAGWSGPRVNGGGGPGA